LGGDPEFTLLHYLIQKRNWKIKDVEDWNDADTSMKAIIYGSTLARIVQDKQDAAKIKKKPRRK
jgi:hypothetical protein